MTQINILVESLRRWISFKCEVTDSRVLALSGYSTLMQTQTKIAVDTRDKGTFL